MYHGIPCTSIFYHCTVTTEKSTMVFWGGAFYHGIPIVLCFKIVRNLVDVSLSDSFITSHDSVTRGHSYKLIP